MLFDWTRPDIFCLFYEKLGCLNRYRSGPCTSKWLFALIGSAETMCVSACGFAANDTCQFKLVKLPGNIRTCIQANWSWPIIYRIGIFKEGISTKTISLFFFVKVDWYCRIMSASNYNECNSIKWVIPSSPISAHLFFNIWFSKPLIKLKSSWTWKQWHPTWEQDHES